MPIIDSESGAIEIIENGNSHHVHGTCNPIAALGDQAVDAVACGGMGARSVIMLNACGIKAYRTPAGTVEETLGRFMNDGLEELGEHNACAAHSCH